jgi:hypothetical protein
MRACITSGVALLLLGVGRVDAQQPPRLQVGTPVRATLAAGGTLRYELNLPKRHFVAGRVDQDGVDATVTITGPAGRAMQRAARVGRGGPEAFAFATDSAGAARRPFQPFPVHRLPPDRSDGSPTHSAYCGGTGPRGLATRGSRIHS